MLPATKIANSVVAGDEGRAERKQREWEHVKEVEPDDAAVREPDEDEEIAVSGPCDRYHDEADQEGNERRPDLLARPGMRHCAVWYESSAERRREGDRSDLEGLRATG